MSSGELLLWLLAGALKAGLLLTFAGAIVAALGRAPARTRHSVWAGALLGALLVPALAPWVPDWSIAALRVPGLVAERPVPLAGVPGRADPGRQAAAAASVVATPATDARRQPTIRVGVGATAAAWTRFGRVPPAGWLLGLWLLGCLATLVSFLRALRSARRLEREAAPADARWREQLARARRRVGVRREVWLLRGRETVTPMTWGWLRPVVLLPERALGWSGERLQVVLLHELVHVRRADWLVRLLGRLVCSVYWFNPLVWAAAKRLAVEQEIACDEEVVALGARPSCYARHLLAIARSLRSVSSAPTYALDMARRSQMEGRLMSILDGSRRLRGGRKLAVAALVLIAGLVPALAAIEPWVEEGEHAVAQESPNAASADLDTAGVARALVELEELEREMEPFVAELEAVDAELEPFAAELEAIEAATQPNEVEIESIEAELEPFEVTIEEIEAEMKPHQARLEAIEVELEPFETRLQAFELELEPFEAQLEAIGVELEPFEAQLEAIEVEMEPLERELERLAEEMEPLVRAGEGSAELERLGVLMEEVHREMAPLHERMGAIHEQMEPVFERMAATHREMEPLHERMIAVHREMEPVFERMAELHQELEPLHQRMGAIHQRMEPVFERMGAAHERMRPHHERMGERHRAMEPLHRRMGDIHERMAPLHERMGRSHLELERELTDLVERMLAVELGGVTAAGTDYAPAAARIVDAVSLRVEARTLRIRSSAPELRAILDETLGGQVTSSDEEFAAAAARFLSALAELEIEAS